MVQNVVFVADDAVEQLFVGGSAQFLKRTEIRRAKLQRALLLMDASMLYPSDVLVNPHQGLDAYCSLAMTTEQ